MKIKDPKQRYVYFFTFRGDEKPTYATVAYSVTQAVTQLAKKHPHANIYSYFDNYSFDITRKPYVPKPEPEPEKRMYKQLSFKGFTDENS